MGGKLILLDPMLGKYASPVVGLYRRFPIENQFDLSELKNIDFVIFSHNHYDHLDKKTVLSLDEQVGNYIVPEGMSRDLIKWGMSPKRIQEVSWHEHVVCDQVTITATPANHYSGRGLLDKNKSACNSWVIKDAKYKLFFSGDSCYETHFSEIGLKYGPFDYGLMECGQYDSHWPKAHMTPEESMVAAREAAVSVIIPIHWAGFALGFHPWKDPIERGLVQAADLGLELATPMIGEPLVFGESTPKTPWWRSVT